MDYIARKKVFDFLKTHDIVFECHEHPAIATVEEALLYSAGIWAMPHTAKIYYSEIEKGLCIW